MSISDPHCELKFFVESFQDKEKLELFCEFLSAIGFSFWPNYFVLSELKYKFSIIKLF